MSTLCPGMNTKDKPTAKAEARKEYRSQEGIVAWWEKDGAWHIALPCPDPDPETGLKTGGYKWTEGQFTSREAAVNVIQWGKEPLITAPGPLPLDPAPTSLLAADIAERLMRIDEHLDNARASQAAARETIREICEILERSKR